MSMKHSFDKNPYNNAGVYQSQQNEVEMRPRGYTSNNRMNAGSNLMRSEINSDYIIDDNRVPQSDLEQIREFDPFFESD